MQLTSDDLFSGLSMLALVLVIAGLVVGFSIARARRHGSTTLALDVTRNASYFFLALCCAGVVLPVFSALDPNSMSLEGDVAQWVTQVQDQVLSPVCPFDDDVANLAETALCGTWLSNAPLAPRLVLYLGRVLSVLASGAIAWAIYNATRRAGAREPFHRSVSRTFGVVAIIVMVAGALGELVQQIAMTMAARSLEWSDDLLPPFSLSIPLWPFAVAVGLFALSAIFRYGAVLQRETEGLV